MTKNVKKLRDKNMAILMGKAAHVWEAILNSTRMHVTVDAQGIVIHAYSPDKPCFRPNFVGQPWSAIKASLEEHGFLVHRGN